MLTTDIYCNLQMPCGALGDVLPASPGYRRLPLPEDPDAGAPFRVIASAEYLYLFRQSESGTLLVNRLRLASPRPESAPRRGPFPKEYRIGDTLEHLSFGSELVAEPTGELAAIDGLRDGNFDVIFLPRDGGAALTCQVFVLDAGQVRIYSLPLDADGQFGGTVPQEATFTVAAEAENQFAFCGAPLVTFYQPRMRNGHVLLTARGRKAGDTADTLVTVEFAVADDGTIANPGTKLIASGVGVTNYTITFDEHARVRFDDIPVQGGFGLDFWLYSTSPELRDQNIVSHAALPDALYARLVDGSAIAVGFTGKNGQPRTGLTAPGVIAPDTWQHVQIVCDPARTANPFRVFVDGDEVPITPSGTGDRPDAAWNQLSDAGGGFIGNLDELRIYNGAGFDPEHLVADWPFPVMEYTDDRAKPPVAPRTPQVKYARPARRGYAEYRQPLLPPPAAIHYAPLLIHFP